MTSAAHPASAPPRISRERFPRGALIAAGSLMAFTILAAGVSRMVGTYQYAETSPIVATRALRFADRADGAVLVRDVGTGALVGVLPPGSNGFIRATVRGLTSARKRQGEGDQVPFVLTAWADGRLTLDDTDTHRRVELEAFGETNEGAFARLLPLPAAQPGNTAPGHSP